jgi:putative transposase
MSHTYSSNRVHVVFSTKGRAASLNDDFQPKLWGYMKGIALNHGFDAVKIGGTVDHVHALLVVPPAMALAKAVQTIKGCSSKWINETGSAGLDFAWQEGYGAFSVSASQTADVIAYIENQAAHHVKRNYEEEFIELLKRHGIAYDAAHVLG